MPSVRKVRAPPAGIVSVRVLVAPRPVQDVTSGFPSSPHSFTLKEAGTESVLTRMMDVVHPAPAAICEIVAAVAGGGDPETVSVTGIAVGVLLEFGARRLTVPE